MEEIKQVALEGMKRALEMTSHDFSDKGMKKNIDAWAFNKEPIIKLLSQSPDWNPETLSVVKKVSYLYNAPRHEAENAFRSMMDMVRDAAKRENLTDAQVLLRLFSMAVEGRLRYPAIPITSERVEDKSEALFISEVCDYKRANPGMKWSRLIQGLLKKWGIPLDTEKALTARYSEWVDAITEKNAEYMLTISVNPADYLLMAYGNTWSSCHIIDSDIARGSGSYNGIHKGGCIDYMNDVPTIMVQLLDKETDVLDAPVTPRIHRNIFFIDPEKKTVAQSKLYPNDGDDSVRNLLMKEVQSTLEAIWGDGSWERVDAHTRKVGTLHYADYHNVEVVHRAFVPKGQHALVEPEYRIGSTTYCIECGNPYHRCDSLSCDYCLGEKSWITCYHCGNEVDYDDSYHSTITNGDYCSDCYYDIFVRCSHCDEEMERDSDEVHWHMDDAYCPGCYDLRFASCDHCGTVVGRWSAHNISREVWCNDCVLNNAVRCPDCGAYHNDEGSDQCLTCREREEVSA